jgi:hypothetical protein
VLSLNTAPWRRIGGVGYSSTPSLTSALDGVSGQLHATATLTPRKETLVPIGQETGWLNLNSPNSFKLHNRPQNTTETRSSITDKFHPIFSKTIRVCTTENTMESRSSIADTFQNVVEKRNPCQSKNRRRRRRRFCVRRTVYHICLGQWRQYAGECACVYCICSVKNKIENETRLTDCTCNLT